MDSVSNNVLCISQRPTLKVNLSSGMLKEERKKMERYFADDQYPGHGRAPIQMQMAASDVMAGSTCSGSSKTNLGDEKMWWWNKKKRFKNQAVRPPE